MYISTIFVFKQKTAYDMRISDWSSDVCSSDLRELTDGLIDLLIEIVHKIGSRARNRVLKAFVTEVERVHGKEGLLVRIAEAACLQPEGMVCDVVFPAAGGADVLAAKIGRAHV